MSVINVLMLTVTTRFLHLWIAITTAVALNNTNDTQTIIIIPRAVKPFICGSIAVVFCDILSEWLFDSFNHFNKAVLTVLTTLRRQFGQFLTTLTRLF